ISAALRQHPELPLRMGIHSGPINPVLDVNERANAAGAGIDVAQRVMDCGDAGHILLSKRAADDLAPYPRWNPHLHDLGEAEVKHGTLIHLVNLFTPEAGNLATPSSITKRRAPLVPPPARRSNLRTWVLAVLIVWSLGGAIWWFASVWARPRLAPPPVASAPAVPEKSIAVLPFENLSEEKANAFFADGVQDEILTHLAKIADLKVISRSSVMQYRSGSARKLREIGKQLGVANLLEGSVQRIAGKVRVNAQLIDARTDAHLWAQTYDRDLADVFAIQSDIARSIAAQLQAKLAPEETARITTKPTDNPEAYLLYLQANELLRVAASREEAVQADKLYVQAIALDPAFTLARARASMLNSLMYSIGRDPVRKERARTLAEEALLRTPQLGEGHLALGLCYYRIEKDYAAALKELALAGAALPNDAEVLDFSGYVYRRQGRWQEALALFTRAKELDPRRAHFDGAPATKLSLRQWSAARKGFEEGLQLEPQQVDGWVGLAEAQFGGSGKPETARATLNRLTDTLKSKPGVASARWDYAMMERDFRAANEVIPDRAPEEFPAVEPAAWFRACLALAQGAREEARPSLEEIKPLYESKARDQPDDPLFHSLLGKLYALLGQKEDAIREARRAVELCPENRDAIAGPLYQSRLAFVYAQTAHPDEAISLLTRLLTTPSADRVTLAHLRLSWEWNPLRQDPRFQKILEGPEPAAIYR
ncbi:MAG: tetratricopeptide repeat protein, partial [Chthoniobacterales bacterium]